MVKEIFTKESRHSLLPNYTGYEHSILQRKKIEVNNFIDAGSYEIAQPDNNLKEDQAKLIIEPIDQHNFRLELSYIRYINTGSENVTLYYLKFLPRFFEQYPIDTITNNFNFRFDVVGEFEFPLCNVTCGLLDRLNSNTEQLQLISSLQNSQTAIQLLQRALECITIPFTVCQVPACRFLAYESEREKIHEACNIIERNLDVAYTIRELARKVAINECYLKKGFKALTGKTVHEYRENLRINKAKTLLQQERKTVTEVANILGFSSISHFSTAFKRVTGMKPCALLS